MTPQSHFMVTAAITPGREPALRDLLATMTSAPGAADPHNAVLPFAEFERLHYARLVVLDDATVDEIEAYGLPPPRYPVYLALMGDCDGTARDTLADMAQRGGAGLRRLFSHCEGFDPDADLLGWLLAHDRPAAAAYVNRIGRTVRQVREESALQRALAAQVRRQPAGAGPQGDPQAVRASLLDFVQAEVRAGRLALTPPEPTPPGWRLRNAAHAAGLPLIALAVPGLLLAVLPWPVVLLALIAPAALFALALRRHETTDPDIDRRPSTAALQRLQRLEDHDVTNQFTAMGAVKPGPFRRWTLTLLLVLLDYACRHVYGRGHLTRVQTIHFARWVFLDDRQRVLFASNYDGSEESYMDDFINKVGWGLNLVFSNGVAYPHTDWLVKRGSRIEQRFKNFLRRRQLPTEVWYRAYPGLTAVDLARNQRIREGLEQPAMSDAQAVAWLRLL